MSPDLKPGNVIPIRPDIQMSISETAKEKQRKEKASRIRVDLYRSVAAQGRDGLREFSEDSPEWDTFKAMANFGLFNQAIDILLDTRKFDPKEYWGKWKSLTGGRISLPILKEHDLELYQLSEEQHNALRKFTVYNPTHLGFFELRGLKLLPPPLVKIIRSSGSLVTILEKVGPKFKKDLEAYGIGLSQRAIAEKLMRQAKEEGRDPSTDPRLVKRTTKKEKTHVEVTQKPFENNRFVPTLREAIVDDQKEYVRSQIRRALLRGRNVQLSPSILAVCPRREGYYKLGFEPKPDDVEGTLYKLMGSSVHYALGRIIRKQRGDQARVEDATWFGEDSDIKGSIDVFWLNPKTHEHQVIDLKIVSNSVFQRITREGLLPHFKNNPNLYATRDHDRRQVLMYMNDKRRIHPDTNVANIVYINADNKEMKEAVILFEDHKEEATALEKEVHEAREAIKLGKLPEPREGVHCRWCPFLKDCEPGIQHLKNTAEKPMGKRKTAKANAVARRGAEEREKKLEEVGKIQASLGL